MAISKEELLKKRTRTQDVEIPDVGTVTIRALTRAEALDVTNQDMTVAKMEQLLLSLALVEPRLTPEETAEWHTSAPAGELVPLVTAITELSGLNVEAAKEAVKRFRG
jgi:hypothetical protein